MSQQALSTTSTEDRDLCNRAQAIADLLRDAYKLGWSLTLAPEQYKVVLEILENGHLQPPSRKDKRG